MFYTHVCVDVPFSNSIGIALIYTTSKFNILFNYSWFYTVFDSQYILFSITNICTLFKNQCCVGVIPPAKK